MVFLVSLAQDVNEADKFREGAEHKASVDHNGVESEISLVQQESPVDDGQVHGFQDGGNDTVNEVDRSDRMDVTEQGNEVVMQDNNVTFVDSSVVKNPTCDIPDEKDMGNVMDFHQEFSCRRELKVFNEPFVNEVPETVSSSVDMDEIADMSIPDKSSNEKSPAMEGHLTEDLEHALQLKQKELEKLVSSSGNLDLSLCDTEDGEIEEGEISGGVDEAKDLLFEDAVSSEETQFYKVQISEHADKEVCTRDDGDARLENSDTGNSLFLDTVDCSNDIVELETKINTKEQQTSAEVFVDSKDIAITGWTTEQVSAVKKMDHPAISLENLAQHGLMHEDTTEIKSDADTKMVRQIHKPVHASDSLCHVVCVDLLCTEVSGSEVINFCIWTTIFVTCCMPYHDYNCPYGHPLTCLSVHSNFIYINLLLQWLYYSLTF